MNKFIEQYYTDSGIVKIPHRAKVLKDQELYQLYKKPKKDHGQEIPHMQDIKPKAILQADLLYLPEDGGYKYALVVVDISTGYTDAEPLKTREAATVLAAFKKITNREPLKGCPTYLLQCDNGVEFKGVFAKYIQSLGVGIRYGKVGRSRQQSYVEQRNKVIGQALFHTMIAQELLTEEECKNWTKRLKVVIKALNAYIKERKPVVVPAKSTPYIPKGTILLSVGQPVRIMLDKPEDTFGKKLHGTFRSSDIRFERKISHISNIIIDDNEPVLYQVDGNQSPAYTYNQLQPVDVDKLEAPVGKLVVEGTPSTYIVQAIKGKRKEKNKIEYLVEWKGYPLKNDWTFEQRTELMKKPKIKAMIDKYESNNVL